MGGAGVRLVQQPWWVYLLAPIVDDNTNQVESQPFAYGVQTILTCFSEALIRVILSFAYVMALANLNGAVINATLAALIKSFALGGMICLMGRVSAYSRLENVFASWFPSSRRMLSADSVQPYADLVHVIAYSVLQYGGSLLGLALALWVSNMATINLGQPSVTADAPGMFGAYTVTASDLWLIEMYGSALLTFAWLMLVVHQRGVKHHIYVGLGMFMISGLINGATIAASGANFDFLHYAALRTVLANANVVNDSHTWAYLVAPLIGAVIAWVGYLIVAWLSFAISYSKPGLPGFHADHDPMLASQQATLNNKPTVVTSLSRNSQPSAMNGGLRQRAPAVSAQQNLTGTRF